MLSAINYVGVRPGQLACRPALTIAKIGAIGVLLVLLFGMGTPHMPASLGAIQPRGFLRALVAGLFAFGGWHMVTYAAEETHNPERIIPRALMLGTAVVVVIYLALNSAYLLVLPFDACCASTHIAFDATLATAGPAAASAISVLVIVSSFGAISGIILAGPRVYYAMAEDGLLFKWMGAVHPRLQDAVPRDRRAGDLVVGAGADRHLRRDRLARRLHRVDLLRRARARHHRAAPRRAATRRRSAPGAFRSCRSCSRSSASPSSSTRSPPIRARA